MNVYNWFPMFCGDNDMEKIVKHEICYDAALLFLKR